jgi:uncharacterized protein
VRVRVTEVDVPRKRIGLSMRKDGGGDAAPRGRAGEKPNQGRAPKKTTSPAASAQGAFGSALADAMKRTPKGT